MRSFCLAFALGAIGCFSPHYENNKIQCTVTAVHACPDGYHCAVNHTCWKNGTEPPPQHSSNVVFGAGGGINPSSGDLHGSTTSFGQPAGIGQAADVHSVQFGILAGTAAK
jgi:hypothetical protein